MSGATSVETVSGGRTMLRRLCTYLSASVLAIGLLLASTGLVWAGEPTKFIEKNAAEVSDLLRQQDSQERQAKFSEKIDEVVDFRELASRALGEHWKARTDEEQQQFLDLLQELLEANYRDSLQGNTLGEDYEIEYLDERTKDSLAIVKTRIKWEEDDRPVDYKMIEKEGAWVIYDIVIDDISLEETYRESYTEIIEQEGWDELISRMKERAEALRAEAE
jgi:phospholipid transport system substrate-binding protein